ncbi:MAG: hypothetical protein R3F53_02510 [Gammaproteobacteria bacterium]
MKDRAIVCNITSITKFRSLHSRISADNIKPQVDQIEFPDGKKLILLSGLAGRPGQRDRTSQFVMSASFTNQVLHDRAVAESQQWRESLCPGPSIWTRKLLPIWINSVRN